MIRYRFLDHTADIRLRIYGRTRRQLFQNAVIALTDTLTDVDSIFFKTERKIRVVAKNQEFLLVHLLKEILFLFDARRFLTRRLVIEKISDTILTGVLKGETISTHPLKTEIKAVTYHGLKIEKVRGRWQAEVVVDV